MTAKTCPIGPNLLIDMLEGSTPDREAIRRHIGQPCRECLTELLPLRLFLTDPWMRSGRSLN